MPSRAAANSGERLLELHDSALELMQSLAPNHADASVSVGADLAERCGVPPAAATDAPRPNATRGLEALFVEVSRHRPLLLLVDDSDFADDVSLGMLAALADRSAEHAILIVVTELDTPGKQLGLGSNALRGRSSALRIAAFPLHELETLVQLVFGGVPNAERFSAAPRGAQRRGEGGRVSDAIPELQNVRGLCSGPPYEIRMGSAKRIASGSAKRIESGPAKRIVEAGVQRPPSGRRPSARRLRPGPPRL